MTDKSKILSGEEAQPSSAMPMPELEFQEDVSVVHDERMNCKGEAEPVDLSNLSLNLD